MVLLSGQPQNFEICRLLPEESSWGPKTALSREDEGDRLSREDIYVF